eukprot:CAMPEP_0176452014 /NCGR_PEP_ID=MMETSP0127-20121128/28254_1 /TAXON_ID=938130 /ORGANISM="Platyophrya macrostoma, Strain WH" /LENGTH=53 /DNA_ID=CAMNT_0017840329 /DNA_START=177 /DNA_END=334 /DNA_ORIENTATION=-
MPADVISPPAAPSKVDLDAPTTGTFRVTSGDHEIPSNIINSRHQNQNPQFSML